MTIMATGIIRQGAVIQVEPQPTEPCAFEALHHSEDRVLVFHGREDPTPLCGFHASPVWLPDVLAKITDRTTQTVVDNTLEALNKKEEA